MSTKEFQMSAIIDQKCLYINSKLEISEILLEIFKRKLEISEFLLEIFKIHLQISKI